MSINFKFASVTRRQALKILAVVGSTMPLGGRALARERIRITPEILGAADIVLDQHFSEERLKVITGALQATLDQFQIVRELEIDDRVEPRILFSAEWN